MNKENLLRAVFGLAWSFVDLVLPPLCLGCGETTTTANCLCPACWGRMNFIETPRCPVWGEPHAFEAAEGILCARALADPPPWSRLQAAVQFDDISARIVHAFKYRDRHEAGAFMARLMHRSGGELLQSPAALVPLPLHRFRLWHRRFNQAAVLAKRLSRMSGLTYEPELLLRQHATKSQVRLHQNERHRNVRGAFKVPSDRLLRVIGRRLVLVDDVVTTGATAKAACEALLEAGAAKVDVLVFALVLKPMNIPE